MQRKEDNEYKLKVAIGESVSFKSLSCLWQGEFLMLKCTPYNKSMANMVYKWAFFQQQLKYKEKMI